MAANDIRVVITRNKKDFAHESISPFTPVEYLEPSQFNCCRIYYPLYSNRKCADGFNVLWYHRKDVLPASRASATALPPVSGQSFIRRSYWYGIRSDGSTPI